VGIREVNCTNYVTTKNAGDEITNVPFGGSQPAANNKKVLCCQLRALYGMCLFLSSSFITGNFA
jgi:hypothetical protein